MKKLRWACYFLVALVVLVSLSGCGLHRTKSRSKINVVSSVNFYGDTAKAVLGRDGTVHSLINTSGVDPHDFQSTPRDAELISNANVVVANGLGYDQWLNDLARDAPNAKVLSVGHLVGKRTGENPHVWYRKQTMPQLAFALANRFGRLEPAHRRDFYRRAHRYVTSLKPMFTLLRRLRDHSRHQKVDVSEPVFDYSLHELGYRVNDPGYSRAVEDDTDPTPAEIKGVQNDLRHHRIAFLVQNVQTSNSLTRQLLRQAKRHHVPILKVSETMPNHRSYRSWMMHQYRQLASIQATENRGRTQ